MSGWEYYNHALVPKCEPHVIPNIKDIEFRKTKAIFARYISEFDYKDKTNFWYVIKDTSFNINEIKSKYRYQIKKGLSNFYSKKINPYDYYDDIINIQREAYKQYGKNEKKKIVFSIKDDCTYIGTFFKDNKKLCGYIVIKEMTKCINFKIMRTIPEYEKYYISEAIVYNLLDSYKEELNNNYYISDGTRTLVHQTNFQEYLIRKFYFRKAYCHLHIIYRNKALYFIINIMCLLKLDNFIKNNAIKGVILMHRISSSDDKIVI